MLNSMTLRGGGGVNMLMSHDANLSKNSLDNTIEIYICAHAHAFYIHFTCNGVLLVVDVAAQRQTEVAPHCESEWCEVHAERLETIKHTADTTEYNIGYQ